MMRQIRPKKVRVEFDLEKEEGSYQEWYSPEDLRRFGDSIKEITRKLEIESRIENDNIYLPLKGKSALFSLATEFLALSPQGDMTLNELLGRFVVKSSFEMEGISTLPEEAKKKLKIE